MQRAVNRQVLANAAASAATHERFTTSVITVVEMDLVLVTGNTGHYRRIQALDEPQRPRSGSGIARALTRKAVLSRPKGWSDGLARSARSSAGRVGSAAGNRVQARAHLSLRLARASRRWTGQRLRLD